MTVAMGITASLTCRAPWVSSWRKHWLLRYRPDCLRQTVSGCTPGFSGADYDQRHRVLLFLPFIGPYSSLVQMTSGELPRQIANAHTIFNLSVSI